MDHSLFCYTLGGSFSREAYARGCKMADSAFADSDGIIQPVSTTRVPQLVSREGDE